MVAETLPYLVAVVFIYALYRVMQIVVYRQTTYFKLTKIGLGRHDLGSFGEYLVYKNLRRHERDGGRFLFNLYIPKFQDSTTEIDVVLITKYGVFVFESKNYSGWIFGRDSDEYWTQTLPVGPNRESHKERFFNPIRQNGLHVQHLKKFISDHVPIWSIIVFSDSCELKRVAVSSGTRYRVVQQRDMKEAVRKICNETITKTLTPIEIDQIHTDLSPFADVDEQVRIQHISRLKNRASRGAP